MSIHSSSERSLTHVTLVFVSCQSLNQAKYRDSTFQHVYVKTSPSIPRSPPKSRHVVSTSLCKRESPSSVRAPFVSSFLFCSHRTTHPIKRHGGHPEMVGGLHGSRKEETLGNKAKSNQLALGRSRTRKRDRLRARKVGRSDVRGPPSTCHSRSRGSKCQEEPDQKRLGSERLARLDPRAREKKIGLPKGRGTLSPIQNSSFWARLHVLYTRCGFMHMTTWLLYRCGSKIYPMMP